jgi:type IV secretory pathway VirB10-like protein
MPQSTSRIANSAVERPMSPAALVAAVLLHAGIIAATLFSWSHSLDIADQSPPVVPVDLVTIGEKTNIAPMVKAQPKEPPKEEAQPPAPEQTQQTATAAPRKEESAPPPDESGPEPLLQKPPPIVPKMKPQPDQKKDNFDINNIVALLDKRTPAPATAPNAKVGNHTIKGIGEQTAMTMDLVDALRNQIAQCWSPPVGAPNLQELVVDFDLFLNPDGSIAQPPQLIENSASAGSSYARAAAEAARRAIYTCAPYKLPADRYSQWREINPFHFDPRGMMGQ